MSQIEYWIQYRSGTPEAYPVLRFMSLKSKQQAEVVLLLETRSPCITDTQTILAHTHSYH